MTITGSILGAGIVINNTITDPSTLSPSDGDRYIVAPSAIGAWAGFDNYIARYVSASSSWTFDFPVVGLQQYVTFSTKVLEWESPDGTSPMGSGWQPASVVRASSFPFLSLTQLDTAAYTTSVPLELDATTGASFSLSVATTLQSPLVRFRGGVITLGSNSLTLNAIDAESIQCFDATGAGTVTVTNGTSINVKWFGAVGNDFGGAGAHDSPAFAAAIACVLNFPQGGELYVPSGFYGIWSGLVVAPTVSLTTPFIPQAFSLRGDGRYASVLQSHITSTSTTMLLISQFNGTKNFALSGISLTDIGFTSNVTSASTSGELQLVNLDYCLNARVTRCCFVGGYNTQLYMGRPQGVVVTGSEFHGYDPYGSVLHDYCGTQGIVFGPSTDGNAGQAGRVDNCVIRDFRITANNAANRGLTPHSGTGIYMMDGAGSEFAVTDCDIENNDVCIRDNVGRNRFVRNSMESSTLFVVTSAADNTGTGTFALSGTPLLAGVQAGAYRIVCTTQVIGGGIFSVYDPTGALVPGSPYTVGAAAFGNQLSFTISAGGTDFLLEDTFVVDVLNPVAGTYTVPNAKNSGTGSIAVTYNGSATPLSNGGDFVGSVGVNGTFLVQCTAAGSPATFTVYDPTGANLGTVLVGSTYTLPTTSADSWTFVITGTGFAATSGGQGGDSFTIVCASDTLIQIGGDFLVESSLYSQNTLSMDGVGNAKFFDCLLYEYIQISENDFANTNGFHVYCSLNNSGRSSAFRANTSLNPRTGMYFYPGLTDGTWIVEGNIERSTTNQTDVAPDGATTPSVSNLQALILQNSAPTTITNFLGGYNGQELTISVDESPLNSTLHNGSNIILASGVDELLLNSINYNFRATLNAGDTTPVWQQIGPYARTLQPETAAYLLAGTNAGAVVCPIPLQYAIDQLVIALKAASLWSTFDALWLFAVNDQKLAPINLVAPASYAVTWHGTVTFTPYYGVVGDGTSGYGDPAMQRNMLPQYSASADSGSLTAWSQVASPTQTTWAIGNSVSTSNRARLGPHVGASEIRGNVNDNSTLTGVSNVGGLSSIVRTFPSSVHTRKTYRNGAVISTDTATASVGTATDNFYLMKDVSTATLHSLPIAMAAIGAGRGDTDEANLYDALLTFMTQVGVVT
jgi:Protein of unknown function (DUF2793)/Pectate lyase superfamily protein